MAITCHSILLLAMAASTAIALPWNWDEVSKAVAENAAETEEKAEAPPANGEHLRNVQLTKQYVPVMKNGTVLAYKTAYFGEVQVGTPQQTFTVVFDTGSGHVILPSVGCTTETCTKHRRYSSALSSTAVDIEYDGKLLNPHATQRDRVVVSFGTGKVTGEFVKDNVCLGTITDSECAELRLVLAVDMTEDPFGLFAFDGVLGLGLNALTLTPKFSFFGEWTGQNEKMHPQFSVFLARHEGVKSYITFGGYDPEKIESDVTWAPIAMAELGYWQVSISSVRIGDQELEECADGECRAVLDTGTSLLGVPRMAARSMHRMLARPVPEELYDTDVDCRHVAGLNVDFHVGDTKVSLPVEDYSRPAPINMTFPANGTNGTNATNATNVTKLFCRSLLLPIDMKAPLGPKIFIWGEPVLRRYLTIYDWAKQQIGFALAKQPEEIHHDEGASGTIGKPEDGSLLAGAPIYKKSKSQNQTKAEDETKAEEVQTKEEEQTKPENQTKPEAKVAIVLAQTSYSVIDHNGQASTPAPVARSEPEVTTN